MSREVRDPGHAAAAERATASTPHPEYAAAASVMRLGFVEMVQAAFELGVVVPSDSLEFRVTRNVSALVRDGDNITAEFEVDVEAVTGPAAERLWASVSRWRITYVGAGTVQLEPAYEVIVRIGFMSLYPYVRALLATLVAQTRWQLPPLPTATISAFGPIPPLSEIQPRLPVQMIMRAPSGTTE